MLYEMIAVVRPPSSLRPPNPPTTSPSPSNKPQVRPGRLSEVKEIASIAGKLILAPPAHSSGSPTTGGVIRSLSNWGISLLASPIRAHQTKYTTGHHFVMRFDCSPSIQEEVKRVLGLDPRVLRAGIVKVEGAGRVGGRTVGAGSLFGMAERGEIRWSRRVDEGQKEDANTGNVASGRREGGGLVPGYGV